MKKRINYYAKEPDDGLSFIKKNEAKLLGYELEESVPPQLKVYEKLFCKSSGW